jgi:hypothetical protein
MNSALNVLLAIGVLANLIKGGDLILRERQKKKLQDRFETFTVWVDDLRPVKWLSYLPNPKPALWWSVFSAIFALIAPAPGLGAALLFVVYLIRDSIVSILQAQRVKASIVGAAMWFGFLLAIPASVLALRKFSRPLIKWLVGDARFWLFLGRLILFYAGSVATLAIFHWICLIGGRILPIAIALSVLWPFTFIVYFLDTTGLLIVTLYMLIRPLNWLVKLLGAVCWRVAEYSQGVFAAFLLIATIALGLAKLVVERK